MLFPSGLYPFSVTSFPFTCVNLFTSFVTLFLVLVNLYICFCPSWVSSPSYDFRYVSMFACATAHLLASSPLYMSLGVPFHVFLSKIISRISSFILLSVLLHHHPTLFSHTLTDISPSISFPNLLITFALCCHQSAPSFPLYSFHLIP